MPFSRNSLKSGRRAGLASMMAVLCERDEAAAKKAQVRASRFLPLHADRASVQKAALTNAAKALAALWNVSRTGRAKHSRGLQVRPA